MADVSRALAVKAEVRERGLMKSGTCLVRQKEEESMVDFLGRAKAIRMKLTTYGDNRPESSACKHIARCTLPKNRRFGEMILLHPSASLSSRYLDEVLRNADHEQSRQGSSGDGNEETRHALVAAGMDRGGGSGRGAAVGDRGNGERDGRERFYCIVHGMERGHNTQDCIQLRKEYEINREDFFTFVSDAGTGGFTLHRRSWRGAPDGRPTWTAAAPNRSRRALDWLDGGDELDREDPSWVF